MKHLIAYFASNSVRPNLIIKGPRGTFDLTATFAHIEKGYGSRTQCNEEEAWRRRAAKEQLKLQCIQYAVSMPSEDENEDTQTVEYWLMPEYPAHKESSYTDFTAPETLALYGVKQGKPT